MQTRSPSSIMGSKLKMRKQPPTQTVGKFTEAGDTHSYLTAGVFCPFTCFSLSAKSSPRSKTAKHD